MLRKLSLIGLLLSLFAPESFTQNAPNFILIYVDDLSAVGSTLNGLPVETPNLQRLANSGVNFTNGHANGTICSPSRASLLTGLYPHSTGYYGYIMGQNNWYDNPILSAADNICEHFKNNGYLVYGSGKLAHNGVDFYTNSFTEYLDVGPNGPWAWDGVSMMGGNPTLMAHPSMPPNFSNFNDGIAPLSDVPSIDGFTGWINRDGSPFNYSTDDDRDLLNDEKIRDYALQIMGQMTTDQPFFLSLGISRPHTPFYLPKKYFDLHPIDEIELPVILEDDLADVPVAVMNNRWNSGSNRDGFRALVAASADSSDQQWWLKRHMQGYLAGVSFVDDILGAILDSLEASPFADNTYVIYTSDHGYHLGEKTFIKKTTLYDVVTKVPFVIAGPGIEQGAEVNKPVSCIDIFPTMVQLAGISLPSQQLDGYSLQPLLESPALGQWEGPSVALTSTASDERIEYFIPALALHQHHTVRSENMRYSLYATGEEELYDHTVDPNELFNLARDGQYFDQKEELKNQLLSLVGIGSQFVAPDTANHLFHGGFEQQFNGWTAAPVNSAFAAQIVSNGEQTEGENYLKVVSDDPISMVNNNLILENGVTYTIYIDGRSQENSTLVARIQRGGDPDLANLHETDIQLSQEWQTFTSTFTFEDPTKMFNNRLRLALGVGTYELDNIRVIRGLPVAVQQSKSPNQQISVFPNPYNTGLLKCTWPAELFSSPTVTLSVYDMNARKVHNAMLNTQSAIAGTFSLPALPGGVYFLEFSDATSTSTVKLRVE